MRKLNEKDGKIEREGETKLLTFTEDSFVAALALSRTHPVGGEQHQGQDTEDAGQGGQAGHHGYC